MTCKNKFLITTLNQNIQLCNFYDRNIFPLFTIFYFRSHEWKPRAIQVEHGFTRKTKSNVCQWSQIVLKSTVLRYNIRAKYKWQFFSFVKKAVSVHSTGYKLWSTYYLMCAMNASVVYPLALETLSFSSFNDRTISGEEILRFSRKAVLSVVKLQANVYSFVWPKLTWARWKFSRMIFLINLHII